jgi:hypothetical protein
MAQPPRQPVSRESKVQLTALLIVFTIVVVGAFAVVLFPRQLGLPGRGATPIVMEATPLP